MIVVFVVAGFATHGSANREPFCIIVVAEMRNRFDLFSTSVLVNIGELQFESNSTLHISFTENLRKKILKAFKTSTT